MLEPQRCALHQEGSWINTREAVIADNRTTSLFERQTFSAGDNVNQNVEKTVGSSLPTNTSFSVAVKSK